MNKSCPKIEDLRFRLRSSQGNQHYALIQYLRTNWENPKQGVIESLEMLWLPFACLEDSHFSSKQIQQMGRRSIQYLKGQIDLICEELDLPNPCETKVQWVADASFTSENKKEINKKEIADEQISTEVFNLF